MDKNKDKLYKIRHSLAHVLAKAVLEVDPGAKLAIGPPVEDGFYYDFELSDGFKIGDPELKNIQKRMRKMVQKGFEPIKAELSYDQAKEVFAQQPYKLELIEDFKDGEAPITTYEIAGFTDLCEGPHVESAHDIDARAFKLSKVAGAYWRGDEANTMLTRIYAYAFETPGELDAHLEMLEEAKKRDHRKIGKEMGLFTFSDFVGGGLPLFTPRGTLMRELIVDKIDSIQKQYGWERVTIPHITKSDLYKTSGHWEQYKDDLFYVKGKSDTEFVMKPMNCPHHTQIYDAEPHSYKELPIRYTETTMVYRDEQAGELLGLSRVRSITQDDGHAFCTEDQIEQEVRSIISIIKQFYTSLGMLTEGNYWVSLSVMDPANPDKYMNENGIFEKAEKILEDIAKEEKLPYKRIEGEAAFYGPKLDFQFKDAIGREWQLGTVQLDFSMPKRFNLTYTNKNGERETPIMIHRAIAGSLERFLSVIIEHYAGDFPTWLSPEQVRVVPVADAHSEYAHNVLAALEAAGIRASLKEATDSLGKRIRNAKKAKVPYTLVLGDKEQEAHSVTAEVRNGEKLEISLNDFIERVKKDIESSA